MRLVRSSIVLLLVLAGVAWAPDADGSVEQRCEAEGTYTFTGAGRGDFSYDVRFDGTCANPRAAISTVWSHLGGNMFGALPTCQVTVPDLPPTGDESGLVELVITDAEASTTLLTHWRSGGVVRYLRHSVLVYEITGDVRGRAIVMSALDRHPSCVDDPDDAFDESTVRVTLHLER